MSRRRMCITCDTSDVVTAHLVPPQRGERNVDKLGLDLMFAATPDWVHTHTFKCC